MILSNCCVHSHNDGLITVGLRFCFIRNSHHIGMGEQFSFFFLLPLAFTLASFVQTSLWKVRKAFFVCNTWHVRKYKVFLSPNLLFGFHFKVVILWRFYDGSLMHNCNKISRHFGIIERHWYTWIAPGPLSTASDPGFFLGGDWGGCGDAVAYISYGGGSDSSACVKNGADTNSLSWYFRHSGKYRLWICAAAAVAVFDEA